MAVEVAATRRLFTREEYHRNGTHCGPVGRRTVEALMDEVRAMGRAFAARRPDALIVVADGHLNVFSFNAVPALAVRIGRHVDRMEQDDAVAFDRALEGLRFVTDPAGALAGADLSAAEREAFVHWNPRALNELGGSLHLLMSIPSLEGH